MIFYIDAELHFEPKTVSSECQMIVKIKNYKFLYSTMKRHF